MEEDALVPVFTSVVEIEFPRNERSPRQVITLYNPYNYIIQYKVLCTAPSNYSVQEANGLLQGTCCKDIVVRCTSRLPAGCVDKLRIEIRKRGESQLHGYRDIVMHTVAERTVPADPSSGRSDFHKMTESMSGSRSEDHRRGNESFIWWCVMIVVFCAVALFLPTASDPSSQDSMVPPWLHLTAQQKQVACFILGVASVHILRPH